MHQRIKLKKYFRGRVAVYGVKGSRFPSMAVKGPIYTTTTTGGKMIKPGMKNGGMKNGGMKKGNVHAEGMRGTNVG